MMANVSPAEVQKYLKDVDYPQNKDGLIEHARSEGAPAEVVKALEGMPEGEYTSSAEVSEAML